MLTGLAFFLIVLPAVLAPWLVERRTGPGLERFGVPTGTALQALGLAAGFLFFCLALTPRQQAFWRPCLITAGFAMQFIFDQVLLGERQGPKAALALQSSQAGWVLLAMGLKGPWPVIGGFNLLLQQFLVTLPLALLLRRKDARPRWLFLGFCLAVAGCLPFSGFSAYFQIFIPLMGVKAAVTNMHEKLYTASAFLGTLVIFSLLYQTCVLGYLVWKDWSSGNQKADAEPVRLSALLSPLGSKAAWACLAFSLVLGVNARLVAQGLGALVEKLGLGF